MTTSLAPVERGFSREIVESLALFQAKCSIANGLRSETLKRILRQLGDSQNVVIAKEATDLLRRIQ